MSSFYLCLRCTHPSLAPVFDYDTGCQHSASGSCLDRVPSPWSGTGCLLAENMAPDERPELRSVSVLEALELVGVRHG